MTEIYDFIANNFEPNDELFFFGFSRGAFTVRSAAALVSNVGILSAVDMTSFTHMWSAWRAQDNKMPFCESAWYRSNKNQLHLKNVQVKVVGVWDTVGALVRIAYKFLNIVADSRAECSEMARCELAAKVQHCSEQKIRVS